MNEPRLFPIQMRPGTSSGKVPEPVYMTAYRVYRFLFGEQEAMIDLEGRGCRGGFGIGELVAFLYAKGFPLSEWQIRFEEALRGMKLEGER